MAPSIKDEWTDLEFWKTASDADIAHCLAEGADVNAQDKNGITALHRAAMVGNLPAMQTLLDQGANIEGSPEAEFTPLFCAIEADEEAVAYLLARGADTNAIGYDGCTPMHLAAMREKPRVVKALLQAGAYYEAPNLAGLTPLDIAEAANNKDCVEMLKDARANRRRRGPAGVSL